MKRRHKHKKHQGKNFFQEFGPESSTPTTTTTSMIPIEDVPPRDGVIRVTAEPMLPSEVTARPTNSDFSYKVETEGTGYHDQRGFCYVQDSGKWTMTAFWKAEGTGSVPMGIRMLGQFQDIFNSLFNVIAGAPIQHQRIEKSGSSAPPFFHSIGLHEEDK